MWATPDEIQVMAHALSGRRFEFFQWFLPQYARGRGTHNMAELVYAAAEFLLICFVTYGVHWGRPTEFLKEDE